MTVFTACIAATTCLLGQGALLDELDLPQRPPEPGAFARLLSTERFVGPGVLSAAQPFAGQPAGAARLRLAADFASQKSLVLVADKLASGHPRQLVEIIAATSGRLELMGLVSHADAREQVLRLLAENGLAADAIRFVEVPTDTVWVRDFGPVFVRSAASGLVAFDFDYARRSGDYDRRLDDSAPTGLVRKLNVPVRRVPLELEQGDVLSNGQGLLVTTTRLFNNNISRGFDARTIERSLRNMFGCETIVVLEPLLREPTGHVDVFACFTDPATIVVGRYEAESDPENAGVLQRNAALLSTVQVAKRPLRVVRLAMAGNRDGVWRTYTNVVFANGTLLVPQYQGADSDSDSSAAATFQRLLPGWNIVRIDSRSLVAQEGALRCVTLNVPAAADNNTPEPLVKDKNVSAEGIE